MEVSLSAPDHLRNDSNESIDDEKENTSSEAEVPSSAPDLTKNDSYKKKDEEKEMTVSEALKSFFKATPCRFPTPVPKGKEIRVNCIRRKLILSDIIARGGFGIVYLGVSKDQPDDFGYAVKIEDANSPAIFSETDVYVAIGHPAYISDWIAAKNLRYLGISIWYGLGMFEHNSLKYRFLVIERYGKDLQSLLDECGTFPLKTVCLVGISVIDVLEYMHSFGFLHNDIKSSNILLGHKKGTENQVYLVDMGLVSKYRDRNGEHIEEPPPVSNSICGMAVFQSRDSHKGYTSRRSDLENLAYNLLLWLTGRLPWDGPDYTLDEIGKEKNKYMNNINDFLKMLFCEEKVPEELPLLLHHINDLQFKEEPNYDYCRNILKDMLKSAGYSSTDYTLEFPRKSAEEAISNKVTTEMNKAKTTDQTRKEKKNQFGQRINSFKEESQR